MPRHKKIERGVGGDGPIENWNEEVTKVVECERCGAGIPMVLGKPQPDCWVCAELELRDRAIKLGLCDVTTAGMLTAAELRPMIEGLEKEGLNVNDKHPSMDPAHIIEEMLAIIAIRNGLQLPMETACKRCELMPMHLAKDCVCHRARAYVRESRRGA